MHKKGLLALLTIVLFASSASAFLTSVTDVNSTFARVSIDSTTNLYAYEINLDYSGTIGTIRHYNFLGPTPNNATYGSSTTGGFLSVYGSRLDSSQTGVSGSGNLFNVTYTGGSLTLRYTLEIYGNGTEIYTYYNNSDEPEVVIVDSGGPSGGGSGKATPLLNQPSNSFDITPDLIKVTLAQGETSSNSFTITNRLNSNLNISSIEATGDITKFIASISHENLVLLPGESVRVNIDFFARVNDLSEAYTGQIIIRDSNGESKILNVIVEINEDSPLFDVVVDLEKDQYLPGELVISVMEIENFGELRDIDVLLYYSIQDFEGNTIVFKEESYAIENYKLQLVGRLELPEDTEPGQYVYYARAKYGEVLATGSQAFTVSDVSFSPDSTMYFVVGIIIIAILVVTLVLYFALRKPKISKQVQ